MTEKLILQFLNLQNLPEVATLHVKAFSESLLPALGVDSVRRYYEWQLLGPHEVVALGAFQNGILKGFCFGGMFKGAMSGFIRKNRLYLLWRLATHPHVWLNQVFRKRLQHGFNIGRGRARRDSGLKVSSNGSPKSFGILSIAVDPECRRSGVGKLLMEVAETAARQRGFGSMYLTVHPSNLTAVGFYENLGWEKRYSEDGSFDGYMSKSLF